MNSSWFYRVFAAINHCRARHLIVFFCTFMQINFRLAKFFKLSSHCVTCHTMHQALKGIVQSEPSSLPAETSLTLCNFWSSDVPRLSSQRLSPHMTCNLKTRNLSNHIRFRENKGVAWTPRNTSKSINVPLRLKISHWRGTDTTFTLKLKFINAHVASLGFSILCTAF